MTRAWDKENLSPRQESNPWPPEHRAGALSSELREIMESKVLKVMSAKNNQTHVYHDSLLAGTVHLDGLTCMLFWKRQWLIRVRYWRWWVLKIFKLMFIIIVLKWLHVHQEIKPIVEKYSRYTNRYLVANSQFPEGGPFIRVQMYFWNPKSGYCLGKNKCDHFTDTLPSK